MRKSLFSAVLLAAACSDGSTEPKVIPAPTLASVSPSEIRIGSPDTTLVFIGTGFQEESVTRLDSAGLVTTYVSQTELRARVPAALLEKGRVAMASVFTLSVAKSSETVGVTVFYAAPTFASMSHDTATAGQANPASVLVTGTGFYFGTQVMWNGQPLTTLYQTPTTVVFFPLVTTPGVYQVHVRNPTPGGGSTATMNFTVKPKG